MRSSLAYQTAGGAHILIKSGVFSRRRCHDNGAVSIVSRYAIKIYNEALDASGRPMQLHEWYQFRYISKRNRKSIESKLRKFAAQRLSPDDLENAIDMFMEGLFNEE